VQDSDKGRSAFVAESGDATEVDPDSFRPIPIGVARGLDVAWAPSGLQVAVAYTGLEGKKTNCLQINDYQLVSQKPLFTSKGDGMGPQAPAWSPDGTKIAFEMWKVSAGTPDTCLGVYVIDANGGKPRLLISGDARQPTWSPDSGRVACAVSRADGRRDIWVVDATGANKVNLTRGKGDNYFPAWSPKPGKKG
jgi:Tol biopolymer transport system component